MNYITAINSFWDSATINPLSTGQVSLYFALLHINNRSNWIEWFTAPNQVLSVLTGLSRSGILKARNELRQRGMIDFKERGTRATSYKLLVIANSTQVGNQDSVQDSTQVGNQDSVQDSSTLIKHKQRQNKNICSSPDERQRTPEDDFAIIYDIYPKKVGKSKAYGYYLGWLKGRVINGKKIRLTNKQMYLAVRKYVCQKEEENADLQFYKGFDTLMNKAVLDYVEQEGRA